MVDKRDVYLGDYARIIGSEGLESRQYQSRGDGD